MDDKASPQWKWVGLGFILWAIMCVYIGYDHGYSRSTDEAILRSMNQVQDAGRYQFVQTNQGIMRGDTEAGTLSRYDGAGWVPVTVSPQP